MLNSSQRWEPFGSRKEILNLFLQLGDPIYVLLSFDTHVRLARS